MDKSNLHTFESQWNSMFRHKIPIGYLFKYYFPDHFTHLQPCWLDTKYISTEEQLTQASK